MTTAELAAIGEALYGPEWQSPLARALSVDARRVREWFAGDSAILAPTALAILLLHELGRKPRTRGLVLLRRVQDRLILTFDARPPCIRVSEVPRDVTPAQVLDRAIRKNARSSAKYASLVA